MSELGDLRKLFTRCVVKLLTFMLEEGDQPMIGKDGLKHMKGSLHYDGLAIDIDLYKDGKYLDKTEDHKVFGEFWESLSPLCCWGGRFKDGNHYSIAYQGRK
ncbi:MAG: M15 family peptidase [Smithella sp.]